MLPFIFENIKQNCQDKKLTSREMGLCLLSNQLNSDLLIKKDVLEKQLKQVKHNAEQCYFDYLGRGFRTLCLEDKYYQKQIINAFNNIFMLFMDFILSGNAIDLIKETPLILSQQDYDRVKTGSPIITSDLQTYRARHSGIAVLQPNTFGGDLLDLTNCYSDNLDKQIEKYFYLIENITPEQIDLINQSKNEIIDGLKFYRNRDFLIDLFTEENDLQDALLFYKNIGIHSYTNKIESINEKLQILLKLYKESVTIKTARQKVLDALSPMPKTIEPIKENDALFVKETFLKLSRNGKKIDFDRSTTRIANFMFENINYYFRD